MSRLALWGRLGDRLIVASGLGVTLPGMETRRVVRLVCLGALAALTVVPAAPAGRRSVEASGGRRTVLLGRSVEGRPIDAVEFGDFAAARKVLVVGCIHGDECAGAAVLAPLARLAPPRGTDLWVVPDLNPDGRAAGTRGNAHGVDLNRNFPWRWARLTGAVDSGPRPLSEPEARIAYRLLLKLRPDLTIWFHQPLDVVDDSTGHLAIERRFAAVARMRLAPLRREPGSAVTWAAHCLQGGTAFVVELPGGHLTPKAASRLARAVRAAARSAAGSRIALAGSCRASR
ncbi:MAG TPA: M14 family zinc carboxypeptidase [Gaiellaceae bacterium]|nr:M14 family zinc carboxypeptidase [Gaiellaceae bacterium]